MNVRRVPWWGWLIAVFVLLRVLDADVPVLPMIIVGAVLVNVLGRRHRLSSGGARGRVDGQGGTRQEWQAPGPQDTPPEDGLRYPGSGQPGPPPQQPMTTIDVPRYPGSGAGASQSGLPTGGTGGTSSDPVVSLGQLHLTRSGRDLQRAAAEGTATELTRVLDEIHDLVTRMQGMLAAAAGTAAAGEREAFAKGLRVLDGQVREARGEHPPGSRVTRVVQTCLRMGHTGRHE